MARNRKRKYIFVSSVKPLSWRNACSQYDIYRMLGPHEDPEVKQLTQRDMRSLFACARNCERRVIILNRKKRVQLMTERARQCVAENFGNLSPQGSRLPKLLEQWIESQHSLTARGTTSSSPNEPTIIERNGERWVLRLVADKADEDLYVLRIEKQRPAFSTRSLQALGLTRREIEVLFWVALGKTNPEIGTILSLSRLTVRTHLEHVYRKLGVETRTAAAAMAYGESPAPCMGELESN